MKEVIIDFFITMPPEWAVFLLSMLPITELRASIPVGIELLGLDPIKTMFIAILGDIIPALFILFFMPIFHDWVMKQKFLGNILTKELANAERKFSGKYAKHGAIALILFVGIPLPFTGAWSGSLASFIFNIPFRKSVPLIFAGVILSAIAVTLITVFAGETFRALI